MEYCIYHPKSPSTHFCPHCKTNACDICVNFNERKRKNYCYVCNKPTNNLGATFNAQPFWRRLDLSFRYPLKTQSLIIILGVAFLSSIVTYLPFGIILLLALTGSFYKYAFTCLENSAWGNFKEVDFNEAFDGGLTIIFQLIGILLGMGAMVFAASYIGGVHLAAIVGLFFAIGYPAILINFALTKSINEALSPMNIIRLISATGLAYGLLLVFIFIMIGSVGVINQALSSIPSFASFILQSAISNYYTLVAFHIMGYMIFQYQGKLGFTAKEDYGEEPEEIDEKSKLLNQIKIWIKEGNANKALELYNNAIESYPDDIEIYDNCYKLLITTRNTERLIRYSSWYFDILFRTKNIERASLVYKEITSLEPNFLPNKAMYRHRIAELRLKKDDYSSTVKLLNGIHKFDPSYTKLGDCYTLLVEALECIPKYHAQIPQAKKLAQHFLKAQHTLEAQNQKPENNSKNNPEINSESKHIEEEDPLEIISDKETTTQENEVKPKELPPIDFPGFNNK